MHLNYKYVISFILFVLFVLKVFSFFALALDSDEVMWSYMAYNIYNYEKHYLYFTTQNFRGSFEAYFLLPFQLIFGYNPLVLRINSFIFSILSSYLIYKNINYILGNKSSIYPFFGVIFYNLLTYHNFVIQTKAWGNYVFAQFCLLLTFYLFNKYFVTVKTEFIINKQLKFIFIIGLISGLSFWANEQSLFYSFVIIFFALMLPFIKHANYLNLRKIFEDIKRHKLNNLVLILGFLLTCFNLYLLIKKRMVFNPVITLNAKFNFDISDIYVDMFNIKLLHLVYLMWFILIISLLLYIKSKIKPILYNILLPFLLYTGLVFTGISINIYHNSFSRVSAAGSSLVENIDFVKKIILPSFFGEYWLFYFFAFLILVFLRVANIYKSKNLVIKKIDIFLTAFFAFLFMFIVSSIPQLTATPRYLIILWPISAILFTYAVYTLNRFIKIIYPKFNLQILVITAFFLPLLLSLFYDYSNYKASYSSTTDQENRAKEIISTVSNNNINYCVGNYWSIGEIMYYSDFKIKCWTDKKYGWDVSYTDFYKEKYFTNNAFVLN